MLQLRPNVAGELTYFWGGWLGLVAHPIYWVIWTYWFPQPYESTELRFFCSVLSIPIILRHHWPNGAKQFFSSYWFVFLMFQLPITFSYLTFKNDFSSIWLICATLMVIVLPIFYPNLKLFLGNLLAGVGIAYGLYFMSVGQHLVLQQEHFTYLLPLPIGVILIMVFSYTIKQEKIKQEEIKQKNKIFKSLAGSIAHEMRNPLSQIHGAIHLLKNHNKSNNDEFHEYYEDVIDVIKNSHQIIDITMDAINEKPIDKLNFQLVSALDICHEAISSYAYKDSELRSKVSVMGSDFQILVDPVLVKYILYNLIGNALYYVQHMPKAEIVISTFLVTRQIQVRDTGPGIAPENLSKLFDSFYTSGKSGGTGLGLAYCKRTMQALEGDIYCESELGEHTAFRLSFPELAEQKRA
ncbi:HAMP domain-containing histidine kinase [Porticoccaceae bacterium]|nr:HAMP domain-containing histidine kinase [Porticoccaceae bacterium]